MDLDGGVLRVEQQATEYGTGPPKTRQSRRRVRLAPAAVELLRTDECTDERVFPVTVRGAGSAMGKAVASLGLPTGVGWHSLRNANAALREQAGQSLRGAAAELGHGAHFAMTMAYGSAPESDEARDVARFLASSTTSPR